MEAGYLRPHEGTFGMSVAAELKYNLQNNMNLGFRAETASLVKCKSCSADLQLFSVTYDFYFHNGNSPLAAFIGAGLGYYFCQVKEPSYDENEVLKKINNPTGFIRTGFELWRFRMSFAYNFIRKSGAENYESRNNDYLSIAVGFYLGGGKWKKE